MGECLISRRGGEAYKLPTLNGAYPQDITFKQSANASATFSVQIAEPGRPAEYTYQWYLNGSAISGATSATYVKTDINDVATYKIHCEITNKAGTVSSRVATLQVLSYLPNSATFSYSGLNTVVDEGNYNWHIKLLGSGTLRFIENTVVDACVVGGGAGGSGSGAGKPGAGGGGGGVTNRMGVTIAANTDYGITIGAGGNHGGGYGIGSAGGASSAFGITSAGGAANGGGVRGDGGAGGAGQNGTYAFGDTSHKRYGPGGGGGGDDKGNPGGVGGLDGGGTGGGGGGWGGNGANATAGAANSGGGGGGEGKYLSSGDTQTAGGWPASGGSGIVIIRNVR